MEPTPDSSVVLNENEAIIVVDSKRPARVRTNPASTRARSLKHDINDLKQAGKNLVDSETRYRRLFETAQDGILLLDAETAQVTDANPFLLKVLGYSHEQLLGRKLWDIGLFQNVSACREAFQILQEKGYIRYEDLPLETRDGRKVQVEFVSNVYPVDGQNVIQCNIRDITDRKRAESEICRLNRELEQQVQRRTAALAASNEEMEAFAYSAAHDLRAPLRHLQGFAELLAKNAAERLEKSELGYVAKIIASAQRMGRLIDDLLGFSRLGRAAMSPDTVDVTQLLAEIRIELESDLNGRAVTWKMGSLPSLYVDPSLLRVVLANLVENALKFTQGQKETIIEISGHREEGMVTIFVRDNGVGFEMDYVDKLFHVFQRLHRNEEFEGTGIGLATVRRIIERHGGKVWAESAPAKGATFYFSLPDKGRAWIAT